MIKFSIGCENDHEFEGWFSSSEEFERLQHGGLVDCPTCGSTKVEKSLMAPSVVTSKRKSITESTGGAMVAPTGGGAVAGPLAMATPPALKGTSSDVQAELLRQMRAFKEHVTANAENVGDKFADEARKIHYGETDERGIYGSATPEDAVELIEEGVEIMPLPVLPEDKN